jgi:hypothetical protein
MAEQREIQVKPQANIYTVLLIITILALGTSTGFVANRLMGPMPGTSDMDKNANGYGMEMGELFEPWSVLEKKAGLDVFSKDTYGDSTNTGEDMDEQGSEQESEPEV